MIIISEDDRMPFTKQKVDASSVASYQIFVQTVLLLLLPLLTLYVYVLCEIQYTVLQSWKCRFALVSSQLAFGGCACAFVCFSVSARPVRRCPEANRTDLSTDPIRAPLAVVIFKHVDNSGPCSRRKPVVLFVTLSIHALHFVFVL